MVDRPPRYFSLVQGFPSPNETSHEGCTSPRCCVHIRWYYGCSPDRDDRDSESLLEGPPTWTTPLRTGRWLVCSEASHSDRSWHEGTLHCLNFNGPEVATGHATMPRSVLFAISPSSSVVWNRQCSPAGNGVDCREEAWHQPLSRNNQKGGLVLREQLQRTK